MAIRKISGGIARLLYRLSTIGMAKGAHVTRYAMYNALSSYNETRAIDDQVLSISGSAVLAHLIGYHDRHIFDASFPEYNMLELPFGDDCFDAVVSDQVLEHVDGCPFRAMEEAFRVLKPGGIACHTTCFINPIHGHPGDFWRFTPDALRLLVEPYGKLLEASGWGNPLVWPFALFGLRREGIPHARWHPAHVLATANTGTWPIVTWVVAEKRTTARDSGTRRDL